MWRSTDSVRILLVEDDPNHAALIERCLRGGGTRSHVRHAVDGQEALEFVERRLASHEPLPDLILLDLNLPRISGHEVLAVLKDADATRSIPVVVLTTSDSEVDRTTAYALHANSYVLKAAEFQALSAMLDDLLRYWGSWDQCGCAPTSVRGEQARGTDRSAGRPLDGHGRSGRAGGEDEAREADERDDEEEVAE